MAGKRPESAFNAAFVPTVKEPVNYFNGHRLYLRVEPSGSRFWVRRIAIRGKRKELGLGNPSLVSLREARDNALANRKMAREGGDPLQAKRQTSAMMTFEEAAREMHRLHLPTWRSAKHGREFLLTLEAYVFLRMGGHRMDGITSSDLLNVLTPLSLKKLDAAKRLHQRIGAVMRWSIAKGWRPDNPGASILSALPKVGGGKTPRKALPCAEVADFHRKVYVSDGGLPLKLALEFLILTAARSGEAREAVWPEINLSRAVWQIPAGHMKMKRGHRVPLSLRSVEVLEAAPGLSNGSGLVFPGARAGRPMTDRTLSKFVKELGFEVDVHGFRTSFRTWAQERTIFPRGLAEFALAHVVGDAAEQA